MNIPEIEQKPQKYRIVNLIMAFLAVSMLLIGLLI